MRILTTALAAAIALAPLAAPALADGTPARTVTVTGITTGHGMPGDRTTQRREATFRASYYRAHGTYPTEQQFRAWYLRTYHAQPR